MVPALVRVRSASPALDLSTESIYTIAGLTSRRRDGSPQQGSVG